MRADEPQVDPQARGQGRGGGDVPRGGRAPRGPVVAAAAGGGTRVVVLSYHRATLDFDASAREAIASMFVSAQTMQRRIEDIARTREIVSLSDARRILAEPPGTRRRDAFVVTFDDGYADNHHVAMPVLAAMKVPATFFVATGYTSTSKRFARPPLRVAHGARRRGIPGGAGLPGPVQSLLSACAEPAPGGDPRAAHRAARTTGSWRSQTRSRRALASPSRISPTTPAR